MCPKSDPVLNGGSSIIRSPLKTKEMIRAEYFLRDARINSPARLIKSPEVSVVLPTYSRAASGLLARSIESVLAQSFQSFELIVMDDGSTDGTAELLSDYVRADERIIHVRHENNSGLPALRVNEGLMLGRGKYCAYQFDDDRWHPGALNALVKQLESQCVYSVAYGKSEVVIGEHMWVLGEVFDYAKLIGGNYIANNSLIHRRSVFEQYGGYDMHLVMRRLCDWDLWLRWGKKVRFLFVDEIVSQVDGGLEGSLGKTVHYDQLVARAFMSRERDHLLKPDVLKDYVLDSLFHLKHLGTEIVSESWCQLVAPFYSRHREIWPKVKPETEKRIHVLVTKAHFDTTVDITINNFRELLADNFAFTFIPQAQVDETSIRSCDILLLHRTIDFHAKELISVARKYAKCVVFFMDDDLLSFHELSDEFSYLAPGAPCRDALEAIITESDLVVTYSPLMWESANALNPRAVQLDTNIKGCWLEIAESRNLISGGKISGEHPQVKIGFAGGSARKEEFSVLWPAIIEVSRQLKDQAEFHFWGFTPNNLDQLESPSYCESFTYSYDEYLSRLTVAGFDVMIVPLFAENKAKRAKCPIKFLECTSAGAIGVFSDVEPYRVVESGVTGFKCENTVKGWVSAILTAASLTTDQRQNMLAKALDHARRVYSSERQAQWVSATLDAGLLHAALPRSPLSGKPRIAYFCHSPYLGGAENHLLRHAIISQIFQFEPVLVLPASVEHIHEEMQRRAISAAIEIVYLPLIIETEVNNDRVLEEQVINQIAAWLTSNQISLVHSVTLMREVGEATRRAGVSHVSSLYATRSVGNSDVRHCDVVHSDSLLYANQWANILGVPSRCILSYVPDDYFHIGVMAKRVGFSGWHEKSLRVGIFGTVQPRKGQRQAVEAIGMLFREHGIKMTLDVYGYDHFFPEYIEELKMIAIEYGISDRVRLHGFVRNTATVLNEIDIVLCASDWESLPQVILEAMAARKLVISPAVGGVAEVLSNKTGVIIRDNSAVAISEGLLMSARLNENDLERRLALAHKVVDAECAKNSVAASLFRLYLFAHSRLPKEQRHYESVLSSPGCFDSNLRETFLISALQRIRYLSREGGE